MTNICDSDFLMRTIRDHKKDKCLKLILLLISYLIFPSFPLNLLHNLILSYLILSYLILSYLILSYFILSYLILSYFILSYFILSYFILSYLILSYLILSYLILSYLILSYLILSHPILSYPVLSNPTFAFLPVSSLFCSVLIVICGQLLLHPRPLNGFSARATPYLK